MPNSTSGPSAVGPPPSLSISSSAFQSPRLRLIARRLESRLVVGWLGLFVHGPLSDRLIGIAPGVRRLATGFIARQFRTRLIMSRPVIQLAASKPDTIRKPGFGNRHEGGAKEDDHSNDDDAAFMTRFLASPVYPLLHILGWLDSRSIARSLINILSNRSRTLDIKIVVPRTRIAIEVPTDRVTGGVDRTFFRLDSRRGQEQPKERRERCQSDDAPDSQIGLLRQFGPLHLIDGLTLESISPTTAPVGSASDSSTLCPLARRFELPFGIRRFAVRASFRESRLRNRHEDDGEERQHCDTNDAPLMARFFAGFLYSLLNVVVERLSRLIADVLSNRVIVLDVEGIVKQGTVIAVEVPTDRMTARVHVVSCSGLYRKRREEQPEERRETHKSDKRSDCQINRLRQSDPFLWRREQPSDPAMGLSGLASNSIDHPIKPNGRYFKNERYRLPEALSANPQSSENSA